jgi:hypothetical protein
MPVTVVFSTIWYIIVTFVVAANLLNLLDNQLVSSRISRRVISFGALNGLAVYLQTG